jgi:hypothetical protein
VSFSFFKKNAQKIALFLAKKQKMHSSFVFSQGSLLRLQERGRKYDKLRPAQREAQHPLEK